MYVCTPILKICVFAICMVSNMRLTCSEWLIDIPLQYSHVRDKYCRVYVEEGILRTQTMQNTHIHL